MEKDFKISIIIPSFNEENNIIPLTEILLKTLKKYNDYEIIFIDDGSVDKTYNKIKEVREQNKRIKLISFSRNFGHQNALKAGYDFSTGDCVISLDSDLQHPPEIIDNMIEKWQQGFQVVYAVRNNFKSLGFFKRCTSKLFYKIINGISDIEMTYNAADFRLVDREVVNAIKEFKENYLYIRGIVSWIGFKQTTIEYKQEKRFSGESKYSLKKMIKFAFSGITSFSIKPLKLSLVLGFIISFCSFIYGLYALYIAFFTEQAITGWTSVIVSVLFIGGIQLFMIGVLGEYLGKLFMENKRRPNYIIKEKKL